MFINYIIEVNKFIDKTRETLYKSPAIIFIDEKILSLL